MIFNISKNLTWLKNNPKVINGICRGIEREALRIDIHGNIANTNHHYKFGSALTHKWITTDFSESQLEFITPAHSNINYIFMILYDLHKYVVNNLESELLWPMSMPCYINNSKFIRIAKYGNSNIGLMKTLYRKGLMYRYGSLMQIITGVHYNFSLPLTFWQSYSNIIDVDNKQTTASIGYLKIIRNYYRFGWVIPYLFGASPAICSSFLRNKNTNLPLRSVNSTLQYLPYATSLRLSTLGYINHNNINDFTINFNSLKDYTNTLKKIINTPCLDYQKIGMFNNNHYLQLNTNILQTENELYLQIRPKCILSNNELLLDALNKRGIEYIEIRSLDINPFSPVGISKEQILFLDVFLIWCILLESPEISKNELFYINRNWNKIILEGRKPELSINIFLKKNIIKLSIADFGKLLLNNLLLIAKILDSNYDGFSYQYMCNKIINSFINPNLTISSYLLDKLIIFNMNKLGLMLANSYAYYLNQQPLTILKKANFQYENKLSWRRQYYLENNNNISFSNYLIQLNKKYNL
ncbi:MAG: glutamate--cysteine ligase [Candidatus Lightella neohaematopini]|nr:glutamate--cysteine ligase [Candidatus Lightella neohaematopini]MCV2528724.1 glutamate--cysteine ligase [Candidatus Lightella neohaematopini]